MANFIPSALLAGQALFDEKQKSAEWRLPNSVAIGIANKAVIANPSLVELRTREDRAANAYMPIRQAATNGTTRAYAPTGNRGDSMAKALSWATFSETFSISLKQADNNVLPWAEMWAASLRNAILNINNRADAAVVALMVADKTQVNEGGGRGTFMPTPDVYELPSAEKNYFLQNAESMMRFNNYNGELIALLDNYAYVDVRRNIANGAQNAVNLGWQMEGFGSVFQTSRTILGTSSYDGSGLVFENGLVSLVPWIPIQNRKPLDSNLAMNSEIGAFGSIDVDGEEYAIRAYATKADTSGGGLGGNSQDVVMNVEVSKDYGYASAPLSTVRGSDDSVIYAIGQLL